MSTDIIELGDKAALICEDGSSLDVLKGTLEELGFKCHTAPTSERAIERTRHTSYDVIVIGETFGGATLETNGMLRYLALLPMAQRRYGFVCLVGNAFRTLDAMQAYAQSVHLVVHSTDLPNLGPILRKGLADFERFYQVYRSIREIRSDRPRLTGRVGT
jgi:hypothetical protein